MGSGVEGSYSPQFWQNEHVLLHLPRNSFEPTERKQVHVMVQPWAKKSDTAINTNICLRIVVMLSFTVLTGFEGNAEY